MSKEGIIELGWKWEHHYTVASGYDYVSPEREGFLKDIAGKQYYLVWWTQGGNSQVFLGRDELGSFLDSAELKIWQDQLLSLPKVSENINISVDGFMKKTI